MNSSINLIRYLDADFAGCKLDRKSTSRTCQFLGVNLISWFSKKQNSVVLSITEAEYVAARSYCAQILLIKQQLEDFGIKLNKTFIRCCWHEIWPSSESKLDLERTRSPSGPTK